MAVRRRHVRVLVSAVALFLATVLSSAVAGTSHRPLQPGDVYLPLLQGGIEPQPGWLQYVNRFRAQANLPDLLENETWSLGAALHSRYMVKEDHVSHDENPASAWYTEEGDRAGESGNVAVSSTTSAGDEWAIDLWMAGPFHALGIVDPRLRETGFGSYREATGTWQAGFTLDVLRGLGPLPAGITYPLPFPRDGGELWLTRYSGNEWPDPLTSCAGYSAPSGPGLILQLGDGTVTPAVSAHAFHREGSPVEHCVFDETSYTNPDDAARRTGRAVLAGRSAVVLMPRQPLVIGERYTASITSNGQTYSWQFSVVAAPSRLPATGIWQLR